MRTITNIKIVFISEDNPPRNKWKSFKVEKFHTSRDASVRGCTLKIDYEKFILMIC